MGINIDGRMWHIASPSRYNVRRNGQTKTWKTRPGEFKIPVKHGLYTYGYITHDADSWHDGEWENCERCNPNAR